MSAAAARPTIAYLAQGKIRLLCGDAAPRTVDSAFGNTIREKAVRAQQKHSWKSARKDLSYVTSDNLRR